MPGVSAHDHKSDQNALRDLNLMWEAHMQREFVTVRDRKLSLWQSAVHKVTTSPSRNVDQTAGRLMRIGAAIHVKAAEKDIAVEEPPLRVDGTLDVQHYAFLSQVYFEHAQARIDSGDLAVESPPWKYSDKDPNFIIECSEQYLEYYIIGGHAPVYHDWQTTGKNNINYSVITYKLPADAKVLLIGDWGTGQSDAVTMLRVAIKTLKPTAILHLGDIYYSGTADECKAHFVDVFKAVFSDPDTPRVPIFTIPEITNIIRADKDFTPRSPKSTSIFRPDRTARTTICNQRAISACARKMTAGSSWPWIRASGITIRRPRSTPLYSDRSCSRAR